MDGWYDEGADDWRTIREMRHMGWFGRVDALRLWEIMGEKDTDYLVMYQWDFWDSPHQYDEVISQDTFLFQERASWPGLVIYERVG